MNEMPYGMKWFVWFQFKRGVKVSKYNRPINRDYFKLKKDPNALDQDRFMKCCGSDKDDDGLNVKKKRDWELIEEYIEQQLFDYPNTETITPVSCKKCGRLLEYVCTLNENAWTPGYLKKDKK